MIKQEADCPDSHVSTLS